MCLFVGSDLGCKLGFVLLNQNEYEFYKGENLDKYFDNKIDTTDTVPMYDDDYYCNIIHHGLITYQ